MKLTKTRLKQLIKEELQNLAENEQFESPWPGKTSPVKRAPVWSAAATKWIQAITGERDFGEFGISLD